MGLFGRIRLDLRKQRAEIATEEEGLAHTGLSAERGWEFGPLPGRLPATYLQRSKFSVIRIDRAADLEIIGAPVVALLAGSSPGNPAVPAIIGVQQPELHVPVSIALDPQLGRPLACGDRIVAASGAIGPLRIPSSGDLDAPNSAIGQVYRTRESVCIPIVAARIERAHDSVIAAWLVAGIQVPEVDIAEAVLLIRTIPDGLLAGVSSAVRRIVAIPAVQGLARGIGNEPCPAPHQVEGVALSAAIGILNPYDRRPAAAARVLDQLLFPAAINATEPELTRIGRHRLRTLKPPPLRRLPGQRSQGASVAADLNIRGAVYVDLDGALAGVVAATCDGRPAFRGLGAYWHDQNSSGHQS